ncbi:MAG: heat shock protein GrpE [Mucilaginibacter sp.]|nr:heat shock protein GrpE [Mucilaginibacter sp.]
MLKKKKTDASETPEVLNENIENDSEELTSAESVSEQPAETLLKEELSLANDKYLRLYAEFDNFRRRTTKERIELLQTAGKDVIVSLIPVLDDFERAVKSMENATDINAVKEGVILVQNKLNNILTQKGLKPMESIGQPFDADLHEAITNIPAPTDDMKGKVIDEMEKGYYLNDKVIRFAKVIVGA